MSGTVFSIEIQPVLPAPLQRLNDLAGDLYYSWDRHTRGLFHDLDTSLWHACRHNPKVFLRRIAQDKLEQAANDRGFMQEYTRTLEHYDLYQQDKRPVVWPEGAGPVAYFCAEFGLHESLPVYSGGLGILAGDYCKAASDMGLPFVAVGLMYRQGNLGQTIDPDGHQRVYHHPPVLDDLPITPALDPEGREFVLSVEFPDGLVYVRVWLVRAGHTRLYLLDTDIEQNTPDHRAITFELYPADRQKRLRQEIILGIGGVRALRRLGHEPSVWHINEGHPALLLIERWRELISTGLEFPVALQLAAVNTVFTTHTPITAGHEVYEVDIIRNSLCGYIEQLGIDLQTFMAMGENRNTPGFNMTSFVLRCSRFHNGVSRIHRDIAAELEKDVWSEIPLDENPMAYVTNGVHVPTFLAREWLDLLNDPGCYNELLNRSYWDRIDTIPDPVFWSTHLSLKANLIAECCRLIHHQYTRNGYSRMQIEAMTRTLLREDVLVIGFARRFATYKRATLLFEFPERLQQLLNDPARPLVFLFAGKAHQNDLPGQDLIHQIHAFSQRPEFIGKILLLEGYDMALARQLVSGTDVWLNTPEYPMEASGTSGMKAGINGVINFSVLDGWWAEAWNGANGWSITPHVTEPDEGRRRRLEAQEMFDTLEHSILPAWFDRDDGHSGRWIRMARESMKTIIPRFNSMRMAQDYINLFYKPAILKHGRMTRDQCEGARELTRWKKNVSSRWHGVRIRTHTTPPATLQYDEEVRLAFAVDLNGLHADDVIVECLLGDTQQSGSFTARICRRLMPAGMLEAETVFEARFVPNLSGLIVYKIRIYPHHGLLCHPFETGFMKWL